MLTSISASRVPLDQASLPDSVLQGEASSIELRLAGTAASEGSRKHTTGARRSTTLQRNPAVLEKAEWLI